MMNEEMRETYELGCAVGRAALKKGAEDVVLIDVHERMPMVDYFVVASADNERLVRAVADDCDEALARAGVTPRRVEGNDTYRWLLIDAGRIVVHVFHVDERDHYELAKLWRDCPQERLEASDL